MTDILKILRTLAGLLLISNLEGRAITEDVASDMLGRRVSLPASEHANFAKVTLAAISAIPPATPTPVPSAPVGTFDTSDLVGLNKEIHAQQISDHSLEMQMVDGIPVYTWNVWAFGSPGGFPADPKADAAAYKSGRFAKQVEIIQDIFTKQPNAVICLQEVGKRDFQYREELLNALATLGVASEYNEATPGTSFGQMTLYHPTHYKVVRAFNGTTATSKPTAHSAGVAGPFDSKTDGAQSDRAFKVYLEEQGGKRRQFAVVNVHLASYKAADRATKLPPLIVELVKYAPGPDGKRVLSIITGDFNYDLAGYTSTDSKVVVHPKGESYAWVGGKTSDPKVTDGFIVVQP